MSQKPMILIVDDNPENIQVLGGLLSDEDYNPAGVSSGERAIAFLKKHKPDLILLDVLMPDMDGYSICRKIREEEANRPIPIIFLTAKTDEKDILKGFESGGVDYITKPFNTSELLARVKTHIELKQVREKLYELSITDDLTGLHNRRHFKHVLRREISRSVRHGVNLCLAIIDIDHFKMINDTHGHESGDLVLRALSDVFNQAFRKCDITGRIGGEEFAVMLPETDLEGAALVTDRFRERVEQESGNLHKGVGTFTVSVGVTQRTGTTDDIDTLMKQADQALYRAKREGRNRVCLYSPVDADSPIWQE
jgi:diguanylate cyclase (GGDEF)-like protein